MFLAIRIVSAAKLAIMNIKTLGGVRCYLLHFGKCVKKTRPVANTIAFFRYLCDKLNIKIIAESRNGEQRAQKTFTHRLTG